MSSAVWFGAFGRFPDGSIASSSSTALSWTSSGSPVGAQRGHGGGVARCTGFPTAASSLRHVEGAQHLALWTSQADRKTLPRGYAECHGSRYWGGERVHDWLT